MILACVFFYFEILFFSKHPIDNSFTIVNIDTPTILPHNGRNDSGHRGSSHYFVVDNHLFRGQDHENDPRDQQTMPTNWPRNGYQPGISCLMSRISY